MKGRKIVCRIVILCLLGVSLLLCVPPFVDTKTMGAKYYYQSNGRILGTDSIHICISDTNSKKQKGAEFRIAREATSEELANAWLAKEKITYAADKYTIVYEDFRSSDIFDNGSPEMEMSKDGLLSVIGLPNGTYFLIETKAPEGCHLVEDPIRFTIDKNGYLTGTDRVRDNTERRDNTIVVVHRKCSLSDSDYLSTPLLTATGFAIISAVLTWFSIQLKKENICQPG